MGSAHSRRRTGTSGRGADTYQAIVHAVRAVLVLAAGTIIITITEQTVLDAPVPAEEIRRGTGEPLETLLRVVALWPVSGSLLVVSKFSRFSRPRSNSGWSSRVPVPGVGGRRHLVDRIW